MTVRKQLEQELIQLKTELSEMCALTQGMIEDAVKALLNKDRELGKSIGERDKQVNEYELAIEKRCMRILLRQQPVAKDFREVSTVLKMITDVERFGDQAEDIGDLVYTMPGEKYIKKLTHIKEMGQLAVQMARDSVASFIEKDGALADEVVRLDDTMDGLFHTVKGDLIELIQKDSANGDQALALMMVAKYLERIGDHAVNVAEWTKYRKTGLHMKF